MRPRAFAIKRRGVKAQKTRAGIIHLQLMPGHAGALARIQPRQLLPIQCRKKIRDGPPFRFAGLDADQLRDRLVEIKYAAFLIHHQHAVLDGVEQRFQKAPLARQPFDDRLQPFGVEPA